MALAAVGDDAGPGRAGRGPSLLRDPGAKTVLVTPVSLYAVGSARETQVPAVTISRVKALRHLEECREPCVPMRVPTRAAQSGTSPSSRRGLWWFVPVFVTAGLTTRS